MSLNGPYAAAVSTVDGQLAQHQLVQLYALAGFVDVDAHESPCGVGVEHDALRDLAALDARLLRKVDVTRVCVGEVTEFARAGLLEGQGACFTDVVHAITYLKRPADAERIREKLRRAGFAGFPHALVAAPICRPDLLCETEALAVLPKPG